MRRAVYWLSLLPCFAGILSAQKQTIVLDFSLSMAGFAGPQNRLSGTVERLGYILSAAAPVECRGMSQHRGKPPSLQPLGLREAASRFGSVASYGGDTPLLWSLRHTVENGSSDILLITDAMEDGGQIEKAAVQLSQMARQNWAIGIVAVMLDFNGVYFTEQTIPIGFSLKIIQNEVQAQNSSWSVTKSAAACGQSQCYSYTGKRPMLFVAFSRSGSLPRLLASIQQSLKENRLHEMGVVQLAPASLPELTARLDAPALTRSRIKLPNAPGEDLFCSETIREPQDIAVRLAPVATLNPPQPSFIRITSFEMLESKPNWVALAPGKPSAQPDGSITHAFKIICPKGRMFDSVSSLPGKMAIRYQIACEPISSGWWINLSAENSWQYPFRIYKLADLVAQVHRAAIAEYKARPIELRVGMKVQN